MVVTGVSSWCSSGFRDNLQLIYQNMSPCHSTSHNQWQSGNSRVSLTSLFCHQDLARKTPDHIVITSALTNKDCVPAVARPGPGCGSGKTTLDACPQGT